MRAKLTDLGIRQMPTPPSTTYVWDSTLSGFGIRLSPKGKRTFTVQRGKSRQRITLGHWPALSLSDARLKAKRLLCETQDATPASLAFTDALAIYRTTHMSTMRPKTRTEQDRILNLYWKPLHQRHLRTITRTDISEILDTLADKPVMAFNARSALRTFINWCHARDYCGPFPKFKKAKSTARSRILTDDELRLIWRACEQAGERTVSTALVYSADCSEVSLDGPEEAVSPRLPATFSRIVQLLILTGQRRGEIANIQRSWISFTAHTSKDFFSEHSPSVSLTTSSPNLCTLTIPKEYTKNGTEHSIPLGAIAASILLPIAQQLHQTSILFPSRHSSSTPFSGWSKSKAALDKASGVTNWTLHDLRRTWASLAARWGIPEHIAARLQNHRTAFHANPIRAIYNRYEFQDECREAMLAMESRLLTLLEADTICTG